MSTTLERGAANGQRADRPLGAGLADRLPVTRRARRPVVVAAGAALVLVCGAIGGAVASRGDGRTAVLVLARPVPAGHLLSASDLQVARISGSGVHAIAAAEQSQLVGDTVTSSLPAGTLLTGDMVSTATVPAPGHEVVAVAVKPGFFPPGLQPGRAVRVLQVPSPGAAAGRALVLVPRAAVTDVRTDPSAVTVVSVVVDDAHAPVVARAAALGAVSLTLLPVGR